ncbi:MAG TPA: amino acid permease [Rhabdochlamydiaceae bacterium]|nr:amino acid permease [Rhabdochlamydiaceae bacterium]
MSRKAKMNMFMLIMVNLATTMSIKNWPFLAEYGFASIIFFLVSVLTFFVPVSLVSAELASGWPEKEGIFGWVKEAFNEKLGFLAVWLLWIENVIWYPTIFAFIVSTLSYAFSPVLATNAFYNVAISLSLFWLALICNLRGMRFSGWISSFAVIAGTLIPGILIILFCGANLSSSPPSEMSFSWSSFLPDFSEISQLGFLVSMSLGFAGMEMNAVHANDVENPRKNYPYAILISGIIILAFSVLGTISVGTIIPKGEINLVTAIIEAVSRYLNIFGLSSLLPAFIIMIALGSLGGVSAWLTGTSKSLLVAGRNGHLPGFLCRVNKHKVPVSLLVLQGIIASVMCVVFVTMPDLSSGFWTLTVLSAQLYLLMYILMFAAAIVLRYKQPGVNRSYRIPGGNLGMLVVAGVGVLGCAASFCIGFIPPANLSGYDIFLHEVYLIGGCLFFCFLPYILTKVSERTRSRRALGEQA